MSEDNHDAIEWKLIMKKSDLEEPEPPHIVILKVSWEYFNGQGWVRLFPDSEYEDIFLHPADRPRIMKFTCPEDMEPVSMNNLSNYWLRARVLSINNLYAVGGIYQTPCLKHIRLDYAYEGETLPPREVLAVNNLEWQGQHPALLRGEAIKPFAMLDQSVPVVYFGFDQAPLKGPLSIYFSFRFNSRETEEKPVLEWEYLKQYGITERWTKLEVWDESSGFTESGLLNFAGPDDFALAARFGRELYWIRAVNRDGKYNEPDQALPLPVVRGIYLNTIRAVQQDSINAEMLSNPDEEAGKEYMLKKSPVVSEEVWVEEAASLTSREKDEMLRERSSPIRVISDEWGNIDRLWIRWIRVANLDFSGPNDRHYLIDRALGCIKFGDGHHGKIPPPAPTANIEVNYQVGGGEAGNVSSAAINRLQVSLAYIDCVFNPEPAVGGCNRETIGEAIYRAPHTIKHGNRAVTAEDFETICREVSRNVERVRCLANTNMRGERETGCLTLVVMPRGGRAATALFPTLKQEIERELMYRTAGNLAFPGKIQIIQPVYLEISINALLVAKDMEAVIAVEREAQAKLAQFFQPDKSGQLGDDGWNIGEYPNISVLYTLLKSVGRVAYVEKVTMSVYQLMDEGRLEIDPDTLHYLPQGMIANGQHQIHVKVRS